MKLFLFHGEGQNNYSLEISRNPYKKSRNIVRQARNPFEKSRKLVGKFILSSMIISTNNSRAVQIKPHLDSSESVHDLLAMKSQLAQIQTQTNPFSLGMFIWSVVVVHVHDM